MARTAPLLLLAASCLLSLGHAAGGSSGLLVDAGRYAYSSDEEPLTNAEAAAVSLDFIAAEAAAAAAPMPGAAAPIAAVPADEWEVWDTEDDDDEENKLRRRAQVVTGVLGATPQPRPAPPPPPTVGAPLDALFDFALGAVAHQLLANHSAEQPVPDFKKEFHARLGPIKVHGHLDAQGGSAGDLSSLFRDGSATLRQEAGGVIVLEAAAGLRHLRLRYRHYSARAGPIRVSGQLEAEASPASLRAQLALVPPCGAQLRSLSVAHVGPLRVRATGLGALRRLLPLLQRWLDRRLRGDVEALVLQRLQQIVNGELRRVACK